MHNPTIKFVIYAFSSGLENREYGRRDPSRWPRGTFYQQKLALTLPTSGGLSVGMVCSLVKATEFFMHFPSTHLKIVSVLIALCLLISSGTDAPLQDVWRQCGLRLMSPVSGRGEVLTLVPLSIRLSTLCNWTKQPLRLKSTESFIKNEPISKRYFAVRKFGNIPHCNNLQLLVPRQRLVTFTSMVT
jgi:hypothetical protein